MRGAGASGAAAVIAAAEPPAPPGFVDGETKPDATNTGPRYSILTTNTGALSGGFRQLTISTNGATYDRVRFECHVKVQASNVTFNDCEFVGDPVNGCGTSQRALVFCTHTNAVGTEFNFCRFNPALKTKYWSTAVFGHKFTVYRSHISGTEDCFGFSSTVYSSADCTVSCSYGHDLVYWQPDALGRAEGSHNDWVQLHNGPGHLGNTMFGNNADGTIDTTEGDWSATAWYYPYPISGSIIKHSPKGTGTQIVGTYQKNWMSNALAGIDMSSWTGSGHAVDVNDNRFFDDTLIVPESIDPTPPVGNLGVTKASGFHFTGLSSLSGNINIDEDDNETPFTAGAFAGSWP